MSTAVREELLRTPQMLASELNVGFWKVERLLLSGRLKPSRKAGRIRLFDAADVQRAAELLNVPMPSGGDAVTG